jgi:tRNA(Ile)-lysidine synthase
LPSGRVVVRPRRAGDRVRTAAGTRKIQDVLTDARVPVFVRDHVGVVAVDDDPVAVIGLVPWREGRGGPAGRSGDEPRVLDVEPHPQTWSSEMVWSRASA